MIHELKTLNKYLNADRNGYYTGRYIAIYI